MDAIRDDVYAPRPAIELLERRLLMSIVVDQVMSDDATPFWVTRIGSAPIETNPGPSVIAQLENHSTHVVAQHRKLFSGVWGSFKDLQGDSRPEDFGATIQFKDGTTLAAQVTLGQDGAYDVIAQREMVWGQYAFTISISDTRNSERTATFSNSITVDAPPTAGQPVSVNGISGRSQHPLLARYVGADLSMLDRYKASVSWGDGTASEGTIVDLGNGVCGIYGDHSYATSGFFDIGVTLSEVDQYRGQCTTYTRASIDTGAVVGEARTIYPTDGLPFNEELANFEMTDPTDSAAHYRATVEWDGHVADAQIRPTDSGKFAVNANLNFVQPKSWSYAVRIYSIATGEQVGIATAGLSVQPHVSGNGAYGAYGAPLELRASSPFSGDVASFHVQSAVGLWESTFSATIHWGDGATSEGVIVWNQDTWTVHGEHTYASSENDRRYWGGVSVHETRISISPNAPQGQFTYDYSFGLQAEVTADMRQHFALSADANGNRLRLGAADVIAGNLLLAGVDAQSITGSVTWDDGTVSAIRLDQTATGRFVVRTSRAFTAAGNYHGRVQLTDGTESQECGVYVFAYREVGQLQANPISAVAGHDWSGIIAVLHPADGISVDELSATINWWDGNVSTGTIEVAENGDIRIIGSHRYEQPSVNQFMNVVVHVSGGDAAAQGPVTVWGDPSYIYAQGRYANFRQREQFTTTVATFTAPDGFDGLQAQVAIDWGDGQTSAGSITRRFDGVYEVTGTHTYSSSTFQSVTTTIVGMANSATARTSIYLERNPVVVSPDVDVITDRFDVSGRLAVFINEDPGTASERVYHAALVDWGDGEISQGNIIDHGDGTFEIQGGHHYAQPGEYKVTLIERQTRRSDTPVWSCCDGLVRCLAANDASTTEGDKLFRLDLFVAKITGEATARTSMPEGSGTATGHGYLLGAFSNAQITLAGNDLLSPDDPILGAASQLL